MQPFSLDTIMIPYFKIPKCRQNEFFRHFVVEESVKPKRSSSEMNKEANEMVKSNQKVRCGSRQWRGAEGFGDTSKSAETFACFENNRNKIKRITVVESTCMQLEIRGIPCTDTYIREALRLKLDFI